MNVNEYTPGRIRDMTKDLAAGEAELRKLLDLLRTFYPAKQPATKMLERLLEPKNTAVTGFDLARVQITDGVAPALCMNPVELHDIWFDARGRGRAVPNEEPIRKSPIPRPTLEEHVAIAATLKRAWAVIGEAYSTAGHILGIKHPVTRFARRVYDLFEPIWADLDTEFCRDAAANDWWPLIRFNPYTQERPTLENILRTPEKPQEPRSQAGTPTPASANRRAPPPPPPAAGGFRTTPAEYSFLIPAPAAPGSSGKHLRVCASV